MAVTNNIREIREQRGIYQDDLAAAIGYSTKTVGRIERGDSTCKLCLNGMPVPLLRNCYSIFNGTKYR